VDIQHALLSKVVLDGDIVTPIKARITDDFFTDDRYRRVWQYLIDYWGKYGDAPNAAAMKIAFPSYSWKPEPQPIEYFIDLLQQRRKRAIFTDALSQAAGLLQANDEPDAVDQMEVVLREALWQARLETAPTLDMDFSDEASDRTVDDLLEDRMDNPGYLRGISTGFAGIDKVTGGLQPEQFLCLIGLPKSLKSSTLLYMAWACHRQAKSPFFLGFEMSNIEQMDRLLSIISGVGLTKIMTGTLTLKEKRQVMRAFRALQGMKPFVLSVDLASAMTVSGIQAKVREYMPDVVYVDGAYMMMSELAKVEQGSPQALTDIARSLKRLAQNLRIPIVVTTQASATRSKGGQLNPYSAMYTQAWQQSADVLLGVERISVEDENDRSEVPIKVRVLNSRSGPRTDTTVVWDWTHGTVTELTANPYQRTGTDDEDD
jgi:replicative DNA helicase